MINDLPFGLLLSELLALGIEREVESFMCGYFRVRTNQKLQRRLITLNCLIQILFHRDGIVTYISFKGPPDSPIRNWKEQGEI